MLIVIGDVVRHRKIAVGQWFSSGPHMHRRGGDPLKMALTAPLMARDPPVESPRNTRRGRGTPTNGPPKRSLATLWRVYLAVWLYVSHCPSRYAKIPLLQSTLRI